MNCNSFKARAISQPFHVAFSAQILRMRETGSGPVFFYLLFVKCGAPPSAICETRSCLLFKRQYNKEQISINVIYLIIILNRYYYI